MKTKPFIAAAVIIFVLGIAGSIFALTSSPKNTVRISQDGKILYTINLSVARDEEFEIKCSEGTNTIEIRDGKIRVRDADCPDKTCVKTGWLSSAAMPIVCLPHRLVIEFCEEGGVDAVTR
ncbi:MAG: NusG domain II-containing protein [Ruminococcus sp.]|nr:NusG domain II-containing protein [Ruminococcus sp.]